MAHHTTERLNGHLSSADLDAAMTELLGPPPSNTQINPGHSPESADRSELQLAVLGSLSAVLSHAKEA